jgi:hypothetical protein
MEKVYGNGAKLHEELTRRGEMSGIDVIAAMSHGSAADHASRQNWYPVLSNLRKWKSLVAREIGRTGSSVVYMYSLPANVSASDMVGEVDRAYRARLRELVSYKKKLKEKRANGESTPKEKKRFFCKKKVMPEVNIMPDSIDALIEAKYKNIERLKAIDKTFLRGRKHMEDIETALQSVLPEDVVNELHNTYILPTLTAIEAALRETSYANPSVQVP